MGTGDRNPKGAGAGKNYKDRKNFTIDGRLELSPGQKKNRGYTIRLRRAGFEGNFSLKRWKVTGRVFPSVILVERAEWAFPDSRPD